MERNQTAMMQLKTELKQSLVAGVFDRIEPLLDKALLTEREQIEETFTIAYIIGEDEICVQDTNIAARKYYTQTFTSSIRETNNK